MQLPLVAHFRLRNIYCLTTEEEKLEMDQILYGNVVKWLMYDMNLTRPDISHAVSIINRYIASPRKEHWKWMKWIMRYLKVSLNYGLIYSKKEGNDRGL